MREDAGTAGMGDLTVYSSEYITITKKSDGFYIESHKKGMSLDQFGKLMNEHPEIKVTSFVTIRNTLATPPKPPAHFAVENQRISVEITDDEMLAYVTVCVSAAEFSEENRFALLKEVVNELYKKGIVFGIKQNVLLNELSINKKLLIAEGIPPENGKDSEIRMYELMDVKPELKTDGNVDHYELSLINRVKAGDWLGEMTDPTEGSPGKSVKGNTIMPMPGKKYPMPYDPVSVREAYEDGITRLYAAREGAVYYEGERIGVSNHLEIPKNVDFKTGNIDFEGFITVKGTVEDNFSVSAEEDIEILGEYGIGSVKEISSRRGSIYIRGGIAGKNKAVIKSKKDIYTKYISDATIICEGSVHIGYYCLNSDITAREVYLDSPRGQIIGGNVRASVKVVSSIIGSASEKRTTIMVAGFNRKEMKEKLEKAVADIEAMKNILTKIKQEISIFTNTSYLTGEQKNDYDRVKSNFFGLKNKLKELEDEKRVLVGCLRTRGEGEVSILKKAFPNTVVEIKKIIKEIDREILSTSFYVVEGELKNI